MGTKVSIRIAPRGLRINLIILIPVYYERSGVNEPTRRGVLASAAAIFGVGVGYVMVTNNSENSSNSTDTQEELCEEEILNYIHVGASVPDLPESPESPAFGITNYGIFTYDGSIGDWEPIKYGSSDAPASTINAAQVNVGASPTDRPLISNGPQTVYVDPENGDDAATGTETDPVATIQEAAYRVPIYLRDEFTIDLSTVPETPVTYGEDVLVPAVIGTGMAGQEERAPEPGPFLNLTLQGEQGVPEAVEFGSMMFGNMIGTATANLHNVTISRDSPYDNDNFGLSAYGVGEVNLIGIQFTENVTNGIQVYGARMKANHVDFGQDILDIGIKAKRHGSVMVHKSEGALTSDAFRATANSIIGVGNDNSVTGNPSFHTFRGGLIYDARADSWVGLSGTTQIDTPRESITDDPSTYSAHPDSVDPGEIWYIEESGETEEGFYGQTKDGPVKLG
jgi:hypothetical protein